MGLEENFDFESYAQSQQYQTDQTIFNEWQTRVYTNGEQLGTHFSQAYQDEVNAVAARLNAFQEYNNAQTPSVSLTANLTTPSAPVAKPSMPLWKLSDMFGARPQTAANDFLNTSKSGDVSLGSDLAKTCTDIWQFNFDIMLGPTNPLFVDAERGIPNEHGVLVEVDDYGNPTYEEQIRTIEQGEFLNSVTEKSVKDVQCSLTAEDSVLANTAEIKVEWDKYQRVSVQELVKANGQWTLVFSSEGNYGEVTLYDENKKVIFSCDATSGRIGETDRSKEYEGPIRFGSYTLDPKDISGGIGKAVERNILLQEDWGFYRAPLKPQEGTNIGTRGEFFLHGGFFPGSAGCIDIGTNDRVLFPLLMQHEGLINVEVIQRKRYDILFPNGRQTFNT